MSFTPSCGEVCPVPLPQALHCFLLDRWDDVLSNLKVKPILDTPPPQYQASGCCSLITILKSISLPVMMGWLVSRSSSSMPPSVTCNTWTPYTEFCLWTWRRCPSTWSFVTQTQFCQIFECVLGEVHPLFYPSLPVLVVALSSAQDLNALPQVVSDFIECWFLILCRFTKSLHQPPHIAS